MKKQTIETNLLLNLSIYAPKWWDFYLPSTSQKINAAINAEQNTIGNFGKETKENDFCIPCCVSSMTIIRPCVSV